MPKLNILISIHNEEPFIKSAVESVIDQTFRDFDIWLVNDGSTDKSLQILQSIALSEPRLHIIEHDVKKGLPQSVNELLAYTDSEYIGRMDGDDLCLPNRFATQIAFLDRHKDIGILGAGCFLIDQENNLLGKYFPPETDEQIRRMMVKHNAIVHPTVILRRQFIEKVGGYNVDYKYSQDYELWSRIASHTKFWNLQEPLIKYRIHATRSRQRAWYSFKSRVSWLRHNPSKFTDWLNLIRPLYWLILPFPLAMRLNMRSHFENIPSE